jgi:hypothetical protein
MSILFLLMEFAPVNTTGNFRWLKFIKYINEFNIQPIIITFKEDEGAEYFKSKIDYSLLNDLPTDTIIYRIHCSDNKKYFFKRIQEFISIYFSIKDSLAKRWKPYLFKEIGAIIDKHHPQFIVTSLPPFSSGLLALDISKKFNIPLILDLRDLWALFGSGPVSSRIHYGLTLKEENKIFSYAKAIIGVTPQMINLLQKSHPNVEKNKFHLIPNGFDKEPNQIRDFSFKSKKDIIIIGYVGSFYYEPDRRNNMFKPWWEKKFHKKLEYVPILQDWLYRSPYFFLKTLNYLFTENPDLKGKIFIEFIGHKPKWLDVMLDEFDLKNNFKSHGFVSHEQSIILQKQFDIFLATSEKMIGGEHYCLPSKIFDYVGQNKPILAFVTEGIQKEFLINSGLSIFCDPDNIELSANSIHDLILKGKDFTPNNRYLDQYHRFNLTKKLAVLFDELSI